MKKFGSGVFGFLLVLTVSAWAQASPMNYQGTIHKAKVQYEGVSNGTSTSMFENNTSSAPNMSFTFDNVSGIVSKGRISTDGMWIGFGGTALSPTANMVVGNLQSGGVIRVDGDVAYDMSTNTYTGTGDVIEFVGTASLYGMLKKGWNGQYGTPGAGPGNGWMPGWGSGSGQGSMPGWGGSVSNWGMMGGYGSVSSTPGGGYMAPGGGMMGSAGMGSGGGMGGGEMMGGGGGQGGSTASGKVGMVKFFVTPTTAAMIPVTSGTPDHSNPTPVYLNIMLPAIGLSTQ